ncbi:MAG: phenylalanyl-tRNA synthetase beta chain [Pyrinomonadaceae bacterium]|jgi:phenylalanyl-tRNA synthetase beta chain|nr:phenylalanyl-tRNA synthetase beta chain [Pyrinomonadaceae bacterium]
MLISYNWLRELTGTKLTPLELRERLTMVGLAIDSVDENEGDSLLDVEVPSNRPDCLSHVGIAREVAVIEKSKVQSPKSKVPKTQGKASDFAAVEIEDPYLCSRYAARIVRGVKIGPSPDWLAKRLNEIGQRPINNVADITNYVLHELGQPLHAFDLTKLNGQKIIVRRARAGEKLQTLDGVDRVLDNEMLVIADAERPVALAGIMGGLDSEISTSTVDVLIESAYFDPDSIRRTARKLGMDTEASKRFERGADCENVVNAQARCVELICEIAGGIASEDVIDVYPRPLTARSITFRPERVESLTSLRVDVAEMDRILVALGFVEGAAAKDTKTFVVPSWRVDVSLEEDLVEEIARHVGYEHIGSELPPSAMAGEYQPAELKRRKIRRALTSLGFDEAINLSFIDPAHDEVFALAATNQLATQSSFVTLSNPILEDVTRMRPSLLPGLLQSLRHNFNQGTRDVRLFEIGRVFAGPDGDELPHESESLALILSGGASEQDRAQASRELDFYDLTGALQAAISALNLPPLVFAEAEVKHLRAGQSANISLADGTVIGSAGTLSETISAGYKFRQRVYVAELDLTAVFEIAEHEIKYTPLPRYPSVVRDVTLLVGRNVAFTELVGAIESEEIDDYQRVKLVGTYEGQNIPAQKRSVTLRVEYRSDQRTLRDEEVEERHRRLLDSLLKKFSAVLH